MGRCLWRSVAIAAVLSAGCGGGSSPTAPRQAPSRTGLAAGTALTVTSGATTAPLAGVTLSIGGQTVVTDAGGQARVPAAAPIGTLVDLTHPAHLDRQTSVRSDGGNRLTLWPRTTADGLDEHYTAMIAYTAASLDPPPVGTSPLYRLPQGTDTVVVVPSAELLADGPSMEAHLAAARSATDASGGRVRVTLSASAPSVGNGIVVTTRVDPTAPDCVANRVRAYMQGRYGRFVIVSGEIVFCDLQIARASTVTHELGHALGLQHAPGTSDVMSPAFSSRRASTFGPREALVLRLMLDRTPGNRFPDSDRGVSASSAIEERRTSCQ